MVKKNRDNTFDSHDYYCWYLKHTTKGNVIFSQHKAYVDEIKFTMYIDLVLNPYKERNGKLLTWMDNCSSHCTNEVKRVFREDEIDVAHNPPNTIAMLQVMDLAVNGPIKNHTKQIRSKLIFDAFQGYLMLTAKLLWVKILSLGLHHLKRNCLQRY